MASFTRSHKGAKITSLSSIIELDFVPDDEKKLILLRMQCQHLVFAAEAGQLASLCEAMERVLTPDVGASEIHLPSSATSASGVAGIVSYSSPMPFSLLDEDED